MVEEDCFKRLLIQKIAFESLEVVALVVDNQKRRFSFQCLTISRIPGSDVVLSQRADRLGYTTKVFSRRLSSLAIESPQVKCCDRDEFQRSFRLSYFNVVVTLNSVRGIAFQVGVELNALGLL